MRFRFRDKKKNKQNENNAELFRASIQFTTRSIQRFISKLRLYPEIHFKRLRMWIIVFSTRSRVPFIVAAGERLFTFLLGHLPVPPDETAFLFLYDMTKLLNVLSTHVLTDLSSAWDNSASCKLHVSGPLRWCNTEARAETRLTERMDLKMFNLKEAWPANNCGSQSEQCMCAVCPLQRFFCEI